MIRKNAYKNTLSPMIAHSNWAHLEEKSDIMYSAFTFVYVEQSHIRFKIKEQVRNFQSIAFASTVIQYNQLASPAHGDGQERWEKVAHAHTHTHTHTHRRCRSGYCCSMGRWHPTVMQLTPFFDGSLAINGRPLVHSNKHDGSRKFFGVFRV